MLAQPGPARQRVQIAAAAVGLPDRCLHQRSGQTGCPLAHQRLGIAQVVRDGGEQPSQPGTQAPSRLEDEGVETLQGEASQGIATAPVELDQLAVLDPHRARQKRDILTANRVEGPEIELVQGQDQGLEPTGEGAPLVVVQRGQQGAGDRLAQ